MKLRRPNFKMLDFVKIGHGAHGSREEGMCVMEAVAYVAGEEHSDDPVCVADDIRDQFVEINDSAGEDRFGDEVREAMKPLIPEIIGTRGFWRGKGYVTSHTRAQQKAASARRDALDAREEGDDKPYDSIEALDRARAEGDPKIVTQFLEDYIAPGRSNKDRKAAEKRRAEHAEVATASQREREDAYRDSLLSE